MDNFLTLRQASKITGYHPDYLSFLIRNNKLPAKRIGRTWCVTSDAVGGFIKEKNLSGESTSKEEKAVKFLPLQIIAFHWAAFAAIFVISLVCLRMILWPSLSSYLFDRNIANATDDKKIFAVTQSVVTYFSDVSGGEIYPDVSATGAKK